MDYAIKSIAGIPDSKTKEVKIKVLSENFQADNIEADITKIKAVENLLTKLKNYIGIPIYVSKEGFKNDTGLSILFSPSYKNERKNVESTNDRLYYREIKNVVQIEGGLKGGIKKVIPGLGIPEFEKTILGKKIKIAIGIYWFIEANAVASVGITKTSQEWIEFSSKNNTKIVYGEPSEFVLGASLGIDPKVDIEAPGFNSNLFRFMVPF